METERQYPHDGEIYEFFDRFIGFENSREYFKNIGILFCTRKSSDVAKSASRMIFGYDDFRFIKSVTATKQDYNRVSGFLVKTKMSTQELREVFSLGEVIRDSDNLKVRDVKIQPESESLIVSYSFDRKTAGKMNLISAEERVGEFRVEKGDDGSAQIIIFNHSKNEDYAAVKGILHSAGTFDKSKSLDFAPINLNQFPIKQRIEFIDQVLKYNYLDWDLEEVTKLRVKRAEDMGEETSDRNEVEKAELEGINDAVLHGHNLRTNPFVVRCEKAGYYFPSIVMKMQHKSEPYCILLEILFKFRPDMPEINIADSSIIEENEEKSYIFEERIRKRILDEFFHDIIRIYTQLQG